MDHSTECGVSAIPLTGDDNMGDDWKPRVGMEFESVEVAWQFWLTYGAKVGFGVRKDYLNKNKKDGSYRSCRFVCCKEGRKEEKKHSTSINLRQDTRTGCKARMTVSNKNGRFRVHEFVEEHNHILQLPETIHMLACQCKISEIQAQEIDIAEESGLHPRASFQLMSTQAGGRANLGYTRLDVKNYLRARRQKTMAYGEVGAIGQYFQRQLLENPSFYHAYQLDAEEQITNIFWADAKMIIDYDYFGDVVSLDTTYCTNSAHRPLAVFGGFNHFKKAVIFGAALLYDETTDSFKWLFERFLEAHRQKRPQTIFTDQDQAMAKALREVMPQTWHGLCTWHLMLNGVKHLGNLMKGNSCFLTEFNKCMYEYEEESQFEMAWSMLLSKYNVRDNSWIRSMYSVKEKWATCYMKQTFTLGMRSTQLSESLNATFKEYMKPNVDILQFFRNFEKVVDRKRYNEIICEFESRHKIPRLRVVHSPMLQQLAQTLTPVIFDLFQEEFDMFFAAYIKQKIDGQPLVEYIVTMVSQHVYEVNDVKLLPEQYILKIWTRDAREGVVHDMRGNEVEEDPRLDSTRRYRRLCPRLIRLASEVSSSEETTLLVEKALDDLDKQLKEFRLSQRCLDNNDRAFFQNTMESNTMRHAKGFKKRIGLKRQKRLKSWVELQCKKRKKIPRAESSRSQQVESQSVAIESLSQMQHEVSCSAPPSTYDYTKTQPNHFSFTRFLMAPLDTPMQSLGSTELSDDVSYAINQDYPSI